MEEILSSSPADAVVWTPAPGRWSILEIAAHLADAELLASARIRRVLTQDRPEMHGYKQELWAQSLKYRLQNIEAVSARFVLLRRENAALLDMIGEEAWRLKGRHDANSELTLREVIADYRTHTAKHLEQMRSTAWAYEVTNMKTQE